MGGWGGLRPALSARAARALVRRAAISVSSAFDVTRDAAALLPVSCCLRGGAALRRPSRGAAAWRGRPVRLPRLPVRPPSCEPHCGARDRPYFEPHLNRARNSRAARANPAGRPNFCAPKITGGFRRGTRDERRVPRLPGGAQGSTLLAGSTRVHPGLRSGFAGTRPSDLPPPPPSGFQAVGFRREPDLSPPSEARLSRVSRPSCDRDGSWESTAMHTHTYDSGKPSRALGRGRLHRDGDRRGAREAPRGTAAATDDRHKLEGCIAT